MRVLRFTVAGVISVALAVTTPCVASAVTVPQPPTPQVLTSALAAPFNLAVPRPNRVYVADGGLNLVATVDRAGAVTPIVTDQPGASGVATSWDLRTVAFTTTVSDPQTFENTASGLHITGPRGAEIYADTFAYETANNPDQVNHYGVDDPDQCVIDAFAAIGFPVDYTGGVDSHAYSVAAYGNGWIVADAGANTLWKVDAAGAISTLAVLPPQPVEITADAAAAFGLDPCVVGVTYAFEPVPTDVEVGLDGQLYVTLLPGGPESPALGARGSVYKVAATTGASQRLATGFLGATNLALGWRGEIYVAELFGGRISRLARDGAISEVVALPGVVAVETGLDGSLYAATLGDEASGSPGTIVKVWDARGYWLSGWGR